MPPHLHPRSWTTTSLFGTTLAISFLVVGMPHLLPCPAPRTTLADIEITPDGKRIRRAKAQKSQTKQIETTETRLTPNEEAMLDSIGDKTGRECPVPKPSGTFGRLLGFEDKK